MNAAKIIKKTAVVLLGAGLLLSTLSCAVYVKGDNGQHKGWNKNSNNPHHQGTTNPGHSKGNSK